MKSGIIPIKYKDHRTFDFHRTFGTASSIPEEFHFDTLCLTPDQNADGRPEACTAYTHTDIASNEDGVNYDDVDFTYKNTLLMMDAPYGSPCDMMTALKATTVYGVKSKEMSVSDALKNRRAPYFIVRPLNGSYFDGLVSAMWVKQGCLSIANPWFRDFEFPSLGIPPSPSHWDDLSQVSWHDWEACGVTIIGGAKYIVCKSWQGNAYGDKGYIYFSRNQIDQLLSIKGSGAFGQKHASPEDIQTVQMTLLETALSYARMIIKKMLTSPTNPMPIPIQNEPVAPVLPATDASTYLWDSKDNIRHSMRVIGDELGLSVIQKDLLCDVCSCEGGYNIHAKLVNSPNSIDRGLFQINNYYHPDVTDEMAYDPEWSTRWACQAIINKQAHSLWSASEGCWNKTGKYNSII